MSIELARRIKELEQQMQAVREQLAETQRMLRDTKPAEAKRGPGRPRKKNP